LLDIRRQWVFSGMFLTFKVVEGVRSLSRLKRWTDDEGVDDGRPAGFHGERHDV
jgi:hypothetical protein